MQRLKFLIFESKLNFKLYFSSNLTKGASKYYNMKLTKLQNKLDYILPTHLETLENMTLYTKTNLYANKDIG